jgi:very-short-patch-repair endonuclease
VAVEPFQRGRSRDAYAAGLTRARLRQPPYQRLAHDAYAVADRASSLPDLCSVFALLLPPTAAFCHATAARLYGLPLPLGYEERVHVAVPAGIVVPDRPQLVGHSLLLPDEHVSRVKGLRVTAPARTFLDLASSLGLSHLIALGDAALHLGVVTRDELSSMVATAARRRGVVRARQAVIRLDGRAESPPESWVRIWAEDAGLPQVTPQAVIGDGDGRFVARVDFLFEEYKVVVEYEGSHHRNAAQYGKDLARRNRLSALGYLVVHLEASTLNEATAVRLMSDALWRRGWSAVP